MKIATFNVNSLRAREARVLAFVDRHSPDVLCLQELKLEDDKLPRQAFEERGYHVASYGQKSYNGVAILSRQPIADVARGFDDGDPDPQARFVAGTTFGLRVMCAYMPNGEAVGSDKYRYKLAWLERLTRYLSARLGGGKTILLGDYNIAPADADVHDPALWSGSIHCSADERAAFYRLVDLGLVDAYREKNPDTVAFSWWDYRMLGFPKNKGLRIDHVLVTPDLVPLLRGVAIDRDERKGKLPSDHAPVVADLDLG